MSSAEPRVTRHESELGRWEMAFRRPGPELDAHVLSYTGYREHTASPLRRRQVPGARVTLIISFGEPLRLLTMPGLGPSERTVTSFVAGMHDGPAVTEHAGRQYGVDIKLTPLGAYILLGVPMYEVANRVVELSDVVGSGADELAARLADAPSWAARFALLDAAVLSWISAGPAPSPRVRRVWQRLLGSHGRVPIGALAEEVGWSHRQLVTRVREQLGLPPKSVARILRFQAALRLLGTAPAGGLADVAFTSGYYDQAHLNRDFRQLAGATPTELLAARLPGGAGLLG